MGKSPAQGGGGETKSQLIMEALQCRINAVVYRELSHRTFSPKSLWKAPMKKLRPG